MTPLPTYLFATGKDLGAGLIIKTTNPLIIGRIILFENYLEMLAQVNGGKFTASAQVEGYSILIAYAGILGRGNVLQGNGPDAINQAETVLQEMAANYLTEKIENHRPRYRRYEL